MSEYRKQLEDQEKYFAATTFAAAVVEQQFPLHLGKLISDYSEEEDEEWIIRIGLGEGWDSPDNLELEVWDLLNAIECLGKESRDVSATKASQ